MYVLLSYVRWLLEHLPGCVISKWSDSAAQIPSAFNSCTSAASRVSVLLVRDNMSFGMGKIGKNATHPTQVPRLKRFQKRFVAKLKACDLFGWLDSGSGAKGITGQTVAGSIATFSFKWNENELFGLLSHFALTVYQHGQDKVCSHSSLICCKSSVITASVFKKLKALNSKRKVQTLNGRNKSETCRGSKWSPPIKVMIMTNLQSKILASWTAHQAQSPGMETFSPGWDVSPMHQG